MKYFDRFFGFFQKMRMLFSPKMDPSYAWQGYLPGLTFATRVKNQLPNNWPQFPSLIGFFVLLGLFLPKNPTIPLPQKDKWSVHQHKAWGTTTICSSTQLNIALMYVNDSSPNPDPNSNPNNTTSGFTWYADDNPNVSGESLIAQTQTGSTINNTLVNKSGSDQTVTYHVTDPYSQTYVETVIVKPEPSFSNTTTSTCSNVALNFTLGVSIVDQPNPTQPENGIAGPTFSWVATANANVSGESTTAQSGSKLTDKLINTTLSDQVVVYTVTPTGANGCVGQNFTVSVTVKPEPVYPSNTTSICSNVALDYAFVLQNNTTANPDQPQDVPTANSFSWVATANNNVSGESTTAQSGSKLTDKLINTTLSDQVVVYTVTPTGANNCVGQNFTVSVTVKPEPVFSNTTTSTCSNVALNYTLGVPIADQPNPTQPENGIAGPTFSWVAAANNNVGGESTTPQTGSKLTDKLTNTTLTDQLVVYTVTPTGANGCVGKTFTVSVTVKPEPVFSDAATSTCSSVTLDYTLGGQANGVINPTDPQNLNPMLSFSWVATANANVSGESTTSKTGNKINDKLINTTLFDQQVVYTVTPTGANGCVGQTFKVTVTVKPEPVFSNLTTNTCSGVALDYALDNTPPPPIISALSYHTFSWVATANANVGGESTSPQNGDKLTDVLTNSTQTNQTVVYTVTPSSLDGCVGASFTVTVTVKPEFVCQNATTETCSNVALDYALGTVQNLFFPNTQIANNEPSFSWVAADNPNVSGESTTPQTGLKITDKLVNKTLADQKVVYTVTDDFSNTFTVTVTVKPEPVFDNATTMTCSNVTLDYTLGSIDALPNANYSGPSFSWVAASNNSVTGESTSAKTGNTINDKLINTTLINQTVVYTVTPTGGNGCVGATFTVTVTVKPEPVFGNTTTSTCSNVTLDYTLENEPDSPNSPNNSYAGSTFSWVAASNANVTGESTSPKTGNKINDKLVNTTLNNQTVVYTVTPTGGDGCVGATFTVTVTVKPEPVFQNASTSTCSNVTLDYTLGNPPATPNDPNNSYAGPTFSWVAADNVNVSGESTSAKTGNKINDKLVNTTLINQSVVYTVTPTGGNGCVGATFTVTVTVKPEPVFGNATTSTCSNVTLDYTLENEPDSPNSPNNSYAGSTFSWVAASNANVTGESTSAKTGNKINDKLINTTLNNQTVVYTVTPTGGNGCVGATFTVTVTVKPEPVFDNATTATCSNVTLNFTLGNQPSTPSGNNNPNETNVGASFSWVAAANSSVTGESTSAKTGNTINDKLINTSGRDQTVVYTVTPTGGNGCLGATFTVTVTVKPEPTFTNGSTEICSNVKLNYSLVETYGLPLNINSSSSSFSWVAAANNNVSGESTTPKSGSTINDKLINTSQTNQQVVYTVTPTGENGCVGASFTVTVTVKPEPVFDNSKTEICSETTLDYTLGGALPTGVELQAQNYFSWIAVPNDNVDGESTTDHSGGSLTDKLVNLTGSDQTVVYIITPTNANGCVGDTFNVKVVVHPLPSAKISSLNYVCTDKFITLKGNPTGGTAAYATHNWQQSGEGAVSINNKEDGTAVVTGKTPGIVYFSYQVTDQNSCSSAPVFDTVTVTDCNPESPKSVKAMDDFMIGDPCTCNNDQSANGAKDGTFTETVTVFPTQSSMTWAVKKITALATGGTAPLNIKAGDLLLFDAKQGIHYIDFKHVDDAGFLIEVEGPNALGDDGNTVLSVSNICQYPEIAFDPSIPADVCASDPSIKLGVSEVNEFSGKATFKVNGIDSIFFNPGGLPAGKTYPIVAVFKGDSVSHRSVDVNNPAFPGCVTSITQNVDIHPVATVEAGPDQIICSQSVTTLTGSSIGGAASTGVWSITTQPSGGDGQLTGAGPDNSPDNAQFSATKGGLYTLTLTTDNPSGPCNLVADTVHIRVLEHEKIDFLICQTLVNITLAPNCKFELTPETVLKGFSRYAYPKELINALEVIVDDGNTDQFVDCPGEYKYTVRVKKEYEQCFDYTPCWGKVLAEDKTAPLLTNPDGISTPLLCTDINFVLNNPKTIGATGTVDGDGVKNIGEYIFTDNCKNCACAISKKWSDRVVYYGCDSLNSTRVPRLFATIFRTWSGSDCNGNTTTAVQEINFVRPLLADFQFLTDAETKLGNNDPYDAVTVYNRCSPDESVIRENDYIPYIVNYWGKKVYLNQVECNFSVSTPYTDVKFPICDGAGIKIDRTIKVFDWCSGTIVNEYRVLIKIGDFEAPTLALPAKLPITLSTGPMDCTASFLGTSVAGLKNAFGITLSDNCDKAVSVATRVRTLGKIVYGIVVDQTTWYDVDYKVINGYTSGLPVGRHKLIISAYDGCYNTLTDSVDFYVLDRIAPVMKCNDKITVTLSNANGYTRGYARVDAKDIDEGSTDNCKLDWIRVRRSVAASCYQSFIDKGYDTNGNGKLDTLDGFDNNGNGKLEPELLETFRNKNGTLMTPLQSFVEFFCCDAGNAVRTELWGRDGELIVGTYDNKNIVSGGNLNFCWQDIVIEDKVAPICMVPLDVTIDCLDKNLQYLLGDAKNKSIIAAAAKIFGDVTIMSGSDCANLDTAYTVKSNLKCGYGTITRTWKLTKTTSKGPLSSTCTQTIYVRPVHEYNICFPKDAVVNCRTKFTPDTIKTDELACDILAVNVSDKRYAASDDECYKIFRTYTVINWCTYDDRCGDPMSPENVYIVDRKWGEFGKYPTYVLVRQWEEIAERKRGYGHNQFFLSRDTIVDNWNTADYGKLSNKVIDNQEDERIYPESDCKGWGNEHRYRDRDDREHRGFIHSWMYTQIIKVYDTERPVVLQPKLPTCPVSGAIPGAASINFPIDPASCLGTLVIPFKGKDDCSTALELEPAQIKIEDSKGDIKSPSDYDTKWSTARVASDSFKVTVGKLPLGAYNLIVVIRDECGNLSVPTRIPFVVGDCKAPVPICVNGLATNLMPDGKGSGAMTVWAKDFIASPAYDCNGQGPDTKDGLKLITKYSINRVGQPKNVDATSLTVTCEEGGRQVLVEIHAWDEKGNDDYCVTYIIVEDNLSICPSGANNQGEVAGTIQTETKQSVQGVSVELSGRATKNMSTAADGKYQFRNLEKGYDYTLTPNLDVNPLNGVSTYDLVLIQKHILGIEPLNSPYKLIAADINNSRSITTLDLIQLRKLILNLETKFTANTSWRFVDATYRFPDPSNPWVEVFPVISSVNNLHGVVNTDFVAIKIGDVNGNASTTAANAVETRKTGVFELQTIEQSLQAGNTYSVSFSAKDLEQVTGYQFTLELDRNKVELVDIHYGIAQAENFGVFQREGLLTASWNRKTSTIDPDATLFTLQLRSKNAGKLSQALAITSCYTANEAYTEAGDFLQTTLQFEKSNAGIDRAELLQNTPNPFAEQTQIGFYLPQATEGRLTIRDAKGAIVYRLKANYNQGWNQAIIKQSDLKATGVLYYTLETPDFTATKKMVLINR